MTTLLTFLGTGHYETVTYTWQGKAAQPTNLFPIAASELFAPERVVVFVTKAAEQYRPPKGEKCPTCNQVLSEPKEKQSYVEQLKGQLGNSLTVTRIPDGRSEAELWELFERVANAVEEGDTVLLDVTHAFRSIPMVVLAVAAYLRRAKNVTIERIVYGAYEARDPFRDPPRPEDRAPVFDLTPLLELLDWIGGAEALLKRGNAALIAERMIATHQTLRRTGAGMPEKLKTLGQKLRTLSQTLHLSRPREVMRVAHELLPLLEAARGEFEQWAKPFALLVDQVRRELEPLAFAEPDTLSQENLERQLRLVEYCLAKGLIVQAVTLAREWVVSYVLLCRESGDWLRRSDRKEAEDALGAAVARLQGGTAEPPPEWFAQLSQSSVLPQLWKELGQLRNDLAHCAMNLDARGAHAIERAAQEIPARLRALLESAPDSVLYGGRVVIDLSTFYEGTARLEDLPQYLDRARELAGKGNEVIITGQAPIWLYLAVAHALHGTARRLLYDSPVTGEVCIFDHSVR